MADAVMSGPRRTDSCFVPCGRHSGPWFCIWTKPGREVEAEEALTREGFPNFFPRHQVTLANRQKRVEFLFPRYGFAQRDRNQHWVPILSLRGVSDILRSPFGEPRALREWVVPRLLARTSPDGVIYPTAPRVGFPARITRGSMTDFVGICTLSEPDYSEVLIEMFGREMRVKVLADAVVEERAI